MGGDSRPGSSRVSMFSDDQEELKIPIVEQQDSRAKHLAVKAEEWNEPGVREGIYTASLMLTISRPQRHTLCVRKVNRLRYKPRRRFRVAGTFYLGTSTGFPVYGRASCVRVRGAPSRRYARQTACLYITHPVPRNARDAERNFINSDPTPVSFRAGVGV